jgi:hypothetical protein
MRRTALLLALLSARVNDRPTVVVVVVEEEGDDEGFVEDEEPSMLDPYARDKETSAGAMQKSISLTLPRDS